MYFLILSVRLYTSQSDVCGRQMLMSKVGPRTEIVNVVWTNHSLHCQVMSIKRHAPPRPPLILWVLGHIHVGLLYFIVQNTSINMTICLYKCTRVCL